LQRGFNLHSWEPKATMSLFLRISESAGWMIVSLETVMLRSNGERSVFEVESTEVLGYYED
jgi:hypothetical protein